MAVISSYVDVGPGQSSNGDLVLGPKGGFGVYGGGTIASTEVGSGGLTTIFSGSTATVTTLQNGGEQLVY